MTALEFVFVLILFGACIGSIVYATNKYWDNKK